jgi:hypothetical protein
MGLSEYEFEIPFLCNSSLMTATTQAVEQFIPTTEVERLFMSYRDTPNLLLSDDDDESSSDNHEEKSGLWKFVSHTDGDDGRIMEDQIHVLQERHVRFDNARIREHGVTLGDHPMCCDPLPLTLDWCHSDEIVYDINDYEKMRHFKEQGRRGGNVSRLNYWKRRKILEDNGISRTSRNTQTKRRREHGWREHQEEDEVRCEIEIYPQNLGFPGHMVKVEIIED